MRGQCSCCGRGASARQLELIARFMENGVRTFPIVFQINSKTHSSFINNQAKVVNGEGLLQVYGS